MLFNTRYQNLLPDALFNELNSVFANQAEGSSQAGYEIAEYDDKFSLELDMPGFAKSDITIDLNDSVLVVSGERKSAHASSSEDDEPDSPVIRSTRRYGHVQKSFKLPDTVDSESIAATMADGVLTLTLPKKAKKETRIAIDG